MRFGPQGPARIALPQNLRDRCAAAMSEAAHVWSARFTARLDFVVAVFCANGRAVAEDRRVRSDAGAAFWRAEVER